MKTMGFLISHKNSEKRRALLPEQLTEIHHPELLYFEEGYGASIGIPDDAYEKHGCHMVPREQVLACEIITDVKLGDADYLDELHEPKILFGWAHAIQSLEFTSKVLTQNHTVVAWEEIYEKGRYIFYRNREVAGEAAVMQAYQYCGRMPYDTNVAIIGNGQTAKGAMRVLHGLGAKVDVYGRKLEQLFREKMYEYDVIINCVMWDTSRTDRLIYKEDLRRMKPGTLIIDISCDPYLEIETSHPTTISDPVYMEDGIIHYAVDNTPAMFPITVSKVLSAGLPRYINALIETEYEQYADNLRKATVIYRGHICDNRITEFRMRNSMFCK